MSSSDSETGDVERRSAWPPGKPLPPELEDINTHPLMWETLPENARDNPEYAAIQAMIDEDTPEQRAENWKNQANMQLKVFLEKGHNKFYAREARDLYSKALAEPGWDNPKLRSVLLSNRSQVSIYLGNWRHALNDALAAVECDSSNVKAFFRGARAAAKLGELDKCLDMCERGSALGNAGEFEKIGREARRAAEAATAREQRAAREREEKQAPSRKLAREIVSRGFKVGLPQADVGARKPFVSEDGVLRWPVVLIYPEVGATEAIEAAGEDDAIADHLQVMFGPDAPPAPWDTDGKYKLGAVEMYYMANAARAISEQELAEALHGGWPEGAQHSEVLRYGPNAVRPVLVDPEKTLGEVLKEDGHVVPGVPVFFVLARGSEYRERFLESV